MGHEVRHDLNSIMSFHEAESVLCWYLLGLHARSATLLANLLARLTSPNLLALSSWMTPFAVDAR